MSYTKEEVEKANKEQREVIKRTIKSKEIYYNYITIYLDELIDNSFCVSRDENPLKTFENLEDAEKFYNHL